jgi:hypothetical protein
MAVDKRLSALQRNNPRISPWGKLLLENLICTQRVKKLPVFYEKTGDVLPQPKSPSVPVSNQINPVSAPIQLLEYPF